MLLSRRERTLVSGKSRQTQARAALAALRRYGKIRKEITPCGAKLDRVIVFRGRKGRVTPV
jgi:hypothetical protein